MKTEMTDEQKDAYWKIFETEYNGKKGTYFDCMHAVHTNQQKIIDGLSGVIESQKQTMEAMGKRLLMIEQVISGSSNPLTIHIGNILNPTAESDFNQPCFYTEADMLAMGEAVKRKAMNKSRHYKEGIRISGINDINLTQILKTINDGKQQ